MTPPFGTTPVRDDFNRADASTLGANWTADMRNSLSPSISIQSNQAQPLSLGAEASNSFNQAFQTDHEAYVTLKADQDVEVWARFRSVSGNAEAYLAWYNSNSHFLVLQYYGPGGVVGYHDITGAARVSLTAAVGDGIGIRVQGSTITSWHRSGPTGSWTQVDSVTDTQFTAGTKVGLLVISTVSKLDDFGGGSVPVEMTNTGTVTPAGALTIRRTSNAIAPGGTVAPAGAMSRALARPLAGSMPPTGTLSTSVTHIGGGAVMTMGGAIAPIGDLLIEAIVPPPTPEPEPVPPARPYEPWPGCETVQFRNPLGEAVTFLMRSGATGRMMPPVKLTSLPVPVSNGSRFVGSAHLERPVAVPVVFPGSITDRAELRRWARVLDPNKGEGVLTVVQGANAGRELTCAYEAGLEDLAEVQGDLNLGHLIFRAAWPYWADGIEQTLTATQDTTVALWFPFFPLVLSDSDAFAEFTVQIDGDVESWPIVDVTGPGDSVVATNVTTGKSWTVSGAIAAGSTLRVDTRPGHKQVLVDGANAFDRLVLPSSLWPLVQGANRIQLSMALTSPASRVDLTWRNQWLSA